MEEYGKNEGFDMNDDREEIYSKAVKAGKRTYFFDVKATRNSDYYLTITESKKNLIKTVIQVTKSIRFSYIRKILRNLPKAWKRLLM